MLNKELEVTLNEAFQYARAHRHEFMTVEHLLMALLDNGDAKKVLEACSADLEKIRAELAEFIAQTTPYLPEAEEEVADTQPTLGFQRVLQRAVFHVQSSGKQEVTGANVDAKGNVAMPFNTAGMYRASRQSNGAKTVAIYKDK